MEDLRSLYPFKFHPIFKNKIWGGSLLTRMAGAKSCDGVGENWVLSAHAEDDSVIANGFLEDNTLEELIEVYMDDLLGEKVFRIYQNEFPLLFKLIDAHDNLSIQVHPDDEAAQRNHGDGARGKTEMWYVMEAEPGAQLVVGFKQDITLQQYKEAVNNNTVEQLLQWIEVKPGDVIFLPPGLVHAIGKGILLAEIQQSSDITYRIYDYNRRDNNGNLRPLHIAEAQDVVSLSAMPQPKLSYQIAHNTAVELTKCDYFVTNLLSVTSSIQRNYQELGSFVVLLCVQGKVTVKSAEHVNELNVGEVLFVPASLPDVTIVATSKNEARLLETYIP